MFIPVRFSLFLAPEHFGGLVDIFESILDRRFNLTAVLPVIQSGNKNKFRINLTGDEKLLLKIRSILAIKPVPL